jgi:UrcA family protein
MTRTTIALFALALLSSSAVQGAETAPQGITVTFSDLDLHSAAGQSQLKLRLNAAAAKLCTPALGGPDHGGSDQGAREHQVIYQACIGRLSDRAMARIQTGRE